jgi:hypothetical protein
MTVTAKGWKMREPTVGVDGDRDQGDRPTGARRPAHLACSHNRRRYLRAGAVCPVVGLLIMFSSRIG